MSANQELSLRLNELERINAQLICCVTEVHRQNDKLKGHLNRWTNWAIGLRNDLKRWHLWNFCCFIIPGFEEAYEKGFPLKK